MDALEAITTTRAIRRFSSEPLTAEEIWICIDAAICAPSGGNIQPWRFLVVTDPATRQAVADVYRRSYDRYEPALLASLTPMRTPEEEASRRRTLRASRHLADHLADVPALVCVLIPNMSMTMHDEEGALDIGTPFASVYPAVQNLMVAARSLGIGTTLTTVYRIYQDELRRVLGIPDQIEIVALVPMGRPKGSFGRPRRKPVETVTYWNAFGNKEEPSR